MKNPRFPPMVKREDGTFGCRGCGGDIPPRRQTWCSLACKKLFDPFYVKQAVKERCGNRCEGCGKDCSRLAQLRHSETRPKEPSYDSLGLPWPYDYKAHYAHPSYRIYAAEKKAHDDARPLGEFDHIIPHSEGGRFVLENIRMLCKACHRARTKAWHAERKLKRYVAKLIL